MQYSDGLVEKLGAKSKLNTHKIRKYVLNGFARRTIGVLRRYLYTSIYSKYYISIYERTVRKSTEILSCALTFTICLDMSYYRPIYSDKEESVNRVTSSMQFIWKM